MKPVLSDVKSGFLLFIAFILVFPSISSAQEGGGLQELLRRAFGGGVKEQKERSQKKNVVPPVAVAGDEKPAPPKIKIFIDPGHGGKDAGAKSADLFMEKNINLRLAEIITSRCEKNERIEVVTSRKDDTDVTLIERIDRANGSGAVLSLSLHTGGSAHPQNFPGLIYVVKGDDVNADPWRKSQYSHKAEAMELAQSLQKSMQDQIGRKFRIVATDRLFLGAFTMPTLIIEPINLADPSDLMKVGDDKYIKKLGAVIARRLISYVETRYPDEIGVTN